MRFSTPPRSVPLSLRIANILNGSALLGWFIFGFGMLFFWTMVMHSDFSYLNFRGEKKTVGGRITGVEETNAKESKRTVWAHHYQYSVAGDVLDGISYTTGLSRREPGSAAVEYLVENPRKSRIVGMRPTVFSSGAQFIMFISIIGIVLAYFGMKKGLRRNHLLENGWFTNATFVGKREAKVGKNQTVYELTFEFAGRDGRKHQSKARTSEPQRLEDEKREPLLYDPENPERSYLLDAIPSRPKFNLEGQLIEKPSAAIRALIIPLAVIAVNILFALHYFSRTD